MVRRPVEKNHESRPEQLPKSGSPRTRIIAEARRHFFTLGFRSITMDDLSKALGISKKTLYEHFPGKTAILKQVILQKSREIEEDLERISADSPSDFSGALRRLLACIQNHVEEIKPPLIRDIKRDAPEWFGLIESRRREMIQRHFGNLFTEGQRSGRIRKDIPVKLIIEILLGATEAIMNPQKMKELDLTPMVGYSAIISVILNGVVTGRAASSDKR